MDEYEIDDFVEESRQRQKPWDDAKAFLAEIESCGVNTVSAMDAVLLHDANIRAEERKAAAERVCEDCRRRGNIDCDIIESCETRSAILNEEETMPNDKPLKPSCSNCNYTFLRRESYKEPCLYCHGHSHWEPMPKLTYREKIAKEAEDAGSS